jgi:fluoride exporter
VLILRQWLKRFEAMTSWINLLTVAVGGAFGAVARHLITVASAAIPGGSGAIGTTVANILGCAAVGALGEYCLINESFPHRWVLAIRVGFIGSLTTFSTFASESIDLAGSGRVSGAAVYMLANLVIGFAALGIAAWLVRTGMAG